MDTVAIATYGYYPVISTELTSRVISWGYIGTLFAPPIPPIGGREYPNYTTIALVGRMRL